MIRQKLDKYGSFKMRDVDVDMMESNEKKSVTSLNQSFIKGKMKRTSPSIQMSQLRASTDAKELEYIVQSVARKRSQMSHISNDDQISRFSIDGEKTVTNFEFATTQGFNTDFNQTKNIPNISNYSTIMNSKN